jgi:hypothetical protein
VVAQHNTGMTLAFTINVTRPLQFGVQVTKCC